MALVQIYTSYTHYPLFQELLIFQVVFHARMVWNVLTIFLKLVCRGQNMSFLILGSMWVSVTNMRIMHRALAWNVGDLDLNLCSSWFRAVYLALPGVRQSMDLHMDHPFQTMPLDRFIKPEHKWMWIHTYVCLSYRISLCKECSLNQHIGLKFNLTKNTLSMSMHINSK